MTFQYVAVSSALRADGLGEQFIRVVMKLAEESEGIQELLTMWQSEENPFDRLRTMDDIKESVRDCLLPAVESSERTCEKCGSRGAVSDIAMNWRCTQCSNNWASPSWNTAPREIKRSFPEWHKHQMRIYGFPADYIHRVIYVSRNLANMRELLEKWINEGSSEEGGRIMLAIDDLLGELSSRAVESVIEGDDGPHFNSLPAR